ncbi:putative protein kinase [Monocercomonoides exilis]|uniref:putative protein kinase n=1 Tax=Monocercomonoides exilis TaxID=2049356 RepID=UPI00355A58F4|nr:putative protein kinase [Monocercomonoides exilis]|eukprot:MONOS_9817.1-p1 / transcript=MONOS_9817.1 / gene=MONOS_9817 / organism=Monocercomonoides_exilis_PA203 / gene_product=protein kinase, putative / transcript_product=protein kinase, putative / location=Mono_scaffold00419:47052-48781(+) / protein_length=357 / sequence_SO=supercontig / SO=protein_coding / is_pseudo=false
MSLEGSNVASFSQPSSKEGLIIGHGAEAIAVKIQQEGTFFVKKTRFQKQYRIQELDQKLRKSRTNQEARSLQRASEKAKIFVPKVINVNLKECSLLMEFIDGISVRKWLNEGVTPLSFFVPPSVLQDENASKTTKSEKMKRSTCNNDDDSHLPAPPNVESEEEQEDSEGIDDNSEGEILNEKLDLTSACQSSLSSSSSIVSDKPSPSTISSAAMSSSCEMHTKANSFEMASSISQLASAIGCTIARLHAAGIVHGDLTTSNMLIKMLSEEDKDKDLHLQKACVYFIDFGLSYSSSSVEDQAVDLYVLERAILATHPDKPQFFEQILKEYSEAWQNASLVVSRLSVVRARGRKKSMAG